MFSLRHFSQMLHQCGRPCLSTRWRSAATTTSSAGDNLQIDLDSKSGVALVTMKNKPANTLSLEFLTEMKLGLDKLEDDRDCRGMILTSGVPGIFSAGIQLTELYPLKEDRFTAFWRTLQDVWANLYSSRLVTMAAISGHAPAGGCLLSVGCDYRLMAKGNYTIGLNETKLGISAPFWFMKSYVQILGNRQADQALQLGTMFSVEQAHQLGLVDQLSEPDQLLQDAQTQMSKWLKIPDVARQLTKEALRRPLYDEMMSRRHEDLNEVMEVLTRESSQKLMAKYLELLKQKS